MRQSEVNLVDFHSHILPGADHGSSSIIVSASQLRMAKDNSISRIIATPHFYPHMHTVDSFLERREHAYRTLADILNGDMPTVRLGAEVLLCENLDKLQGLDKLTIFGTDTLLIELPFSGINSQHIYTVENMVSLGYGIILAHADRYSPNDIEGFIDIGAKIQLNAVSLVRFIKNRHLYDWLDRGLVVALGSDIHKEDKKAYRIFSKAKQKLKGNYLDFIAEQSNKIWNKSAPYNDFIYSTK